MKLRWQGFQLNSATLHKLDDFFGRENLRVQSLFVWTDCGAASRARAPPFRPAPSSPLSDKLFPGTITNSPTHTGKDEASGDIGPRKWVGLSRANVRVGAVVSLSLSLALSLSLSVSLVST